MDREETGTNWKSPSSWGPVGRPEELFRRAWTRKADPSTPGLTGKISGPSHGEFGAGEGAVLEMATQWAGVCFRRPEWKFGPKGGLSAGPGNQAGGWPPAFVPEIVHEGSRNLGLASSVVFPGPGKRPGAAQTRNGGPLGSGPLGADGGAGGAPLAH